MESKNFPRSDLQDKCEESQEFVKYEIMEQQLNKFQFQYYGR